MYARSNKALNSYFYVLLIINVGAVTEALLGNIGGGPYDSILNISFDDLFGKNGLLPIRVLPVNYPPVEETVTFHCLRPGSTTFSQVYVNDVNIRQKLDMTKPVAIFTHGWLDTFNNSLFLRVNGDGWMIRLARDWSYYKNTNVCAVNWSRLSRYIYSVAAYNTRIVGRYVGIFVEYLNRVGMHLDNITLAGHSMGGQICGFAGAYLKSRGLYARTIIAWDPAGPLFTYPLLADTANRLDKSDAKYVQVIHTSTVLGAYVRCGHADFYPNGGVTQRGCATKFLQRGLPKTPTICDHYRAVELFQYSLNPRNKFVGTTCWPGSSTSSCKRDLMGVYNSGVRGKFWLQTTDRAPFCIGCA